MAPNGLETLTSWSTFVLAISTAILAVATIVLVVAAIRQIGPAKEATRAMRDAARSSFEAERSHYEYAKKLESWKAVIHAVESTRKARARLKHEFGDAALSVESLGRVVNPASKKERALANDIRRVLNSYETLLSAVNDQLLDANIVEDMMRLLITKAAATYGPFIDHVRETRGSHALSELVKYARQYQANPDFDSGSIRYDPTGRQLTS